MPDFKFSPPQHSTQRGFAGVTFDPDALTSGLALIADKALFCTWSLVRDAGNPAKPKKVPYVRGGVRLTGTFSDSTLPSRLMNLAEAISAAQKYGHAGVGLVFLPGCGAVGLDFDACVVSGRFVGTPEQRRAFNTFEPYAFIEHSQSGEGLHAIVLGNATTNKMNGVLELFGDKNFLALTGAHGRGIATVMPADGIDSVNALIENLKGTKPSNRTQDPNLNSDLTVHMKGADGQASIDTVRSALQHLDPGMPRDKWLTVIWAIRHGLGDTTEGLDLADLWSHGGLSAEFNMPGNYSGRRDVSLVWNSYDPNHPDRVSVGSLYKMATDKGWVGPGEVAGASNDQSDGAASEINAWTGTFKLSDGDVSILPTPPAKRSYILASTVTAGTYNVLAGSGGTLKTMLMMITAASMAMGQDLGDVQIAQGASMLFLGEEDHAEVVRRLSAVCVHYDFDPAVVSRLVKAFPAAGVDLRLTRVRNGSLEASALVQNVIALVQQHAQLCGDPVRLVVIDHARLAMDGDPDDAAHVTQLTRVLTQIAQKTGAAVMLLAHSPKTVLKQQAKEMSIADVAGSSAFSDNARSGFIVYGMREDDAKAYGIADADRKKYIKLECAKANYGPQGTEWWFEKVTLDDWQTAVLKPVSLIKPIFGSGRAKQQLHQRILDLLMRTPRSVRGIRDQAGRNRSLLASEKEVMAAVAALLEGGRIERRKPAPAEVQQFRLQKGRVYLFVVS